MTTERSFLLPGTSDLDYSAFLQSLQENKAPPTVLVFLQGAVSKQERIRAYCVGASPQTGRPLYALANDPANFQWRHLDLVDTTGPSAEAKPVARTFPQRLFFQYAAHTPAITREIWQSFNRMAPNDSSEERAFSSAGWLSFLRPRLGLLLLRPGVEDTTGAAALASCSGVTRVSAVSDEGHELRFYQRQAPEV
jgi:hypothetical protein